MLVASAGPTEATRETQVIHRGPNKGQRTQTDRRPLRDLARSILLGLYTGTRASPIASAWSSAAKACLTSISIMAFFIASQRADERPRSDSHQFRSPPRLLAHLQRWKAKGLVRRHVVQWNGEPIRSVKTAFKNAAKLAGLGTE